MKTLWVAIVGVGLMFLLVLCGCVAVPTGEGNVIAGNEINQEKLEFLTQQAATREMVLAKLGPPTLIWPEANVYAYHWEISDGVAIWAVPTGVGGIVGIHGLSTKYVFLIQFDENDRVIRHQSRERPVPSNRTQLTLKSNEHAYGDMLREWVLQPLPEKSKSTD